MLFYNKIKKIPEVYGPAAERGSSIHREVELYMNGQSINYPPSLIDRPFWYDHFNELKKEPSLATELEWAFDRQWNPVAYRGDPRVWLRLAIDLAIHSTDGRSAKYIDIKTGKYANNEIKHTQQLQLYALAGFKKHPTLETIDMALWYVDHDRIKSQTMQRAEVRVLEETFLQRSNRVLTDVTFTARPARFNCTYCSYKDICPDAWSKRI